MKTIKQSRRVLSCVAGVVLLLGICAALAGCSSRMAGEYPWHGPLVGPDGKPPPEPSYIENTNVYPHP